MDINKLKGHIPDAVIAQLPDTIAKFELNTPLRLSHFLAQAGHESGGFKAVNENLNYGAKGLLSIFKKYFPTEEKAKLYERKPEKIANLVYGSRMGNGAEASGEGFRFRGRGYIQLTGKSNYKALTESLKVDFVANPDLVATPQYAALSAGWYWNSRNINKLADADDILGVTKAINGGTIGLEDRKHHLAHVKSIIK